MKKVRVIESYGLYKVVRFNTLEKATKYAKSALIKVHEVIL